MQAGEIYEQLAGAEPLIKPGVGGQKTQYPFDLARLGRDVEPGEPCHTAGRRH